MIARTLTAHELALVRRAFETGKADRETLADPHFVFDETAHEIARIQLSAAEADKALLL
jgi:hypothetical protein